MATLMSRQPEKLKKTPVSFDTSGRHTGTFRKIRPKLRFLGVFESLNNVPFWSSFSFVWKGLRRSVFNFNSRFNIILEGRTVRDVRIFENPSQNGPYC